MGSWARRGGREGGGLQNRAVSEGKGDDIRLGFQTETRVGRLRSVRGGFFNPRSDSLNTRPPLD